MSTTDSLFAPDISLPPQHWKDASTWQFEAFALYLHQENCTGCGSVHRHSDVFRMFIRNFPATTERGFAPVKGKIPSTLKVVTYTLPVKEVPICHHCLSADREGTQRILVSTEHEWNLAKQRDREARQTMQKSKASSPSGPPAPLASLL